MTATASQFVGDIPEHYDNGLGPILFEDFAQDIARRAAALNPKRVLELAAGTGIVSRKLRDALSGEVELVVTDLNAPMLDVAKQKFGDGENVSFQPADAMALPFEAGEFDLIVCQFGVMFFPDKVAANREVARVLAADGHYLFSTWGPWAANPFGEIAHKTCAAFFPDNPPGFYHVPFSYADPDLVIADASAGGLKNTVHDVVSLQKRVTDWQPFARGLVFGNPLADEIKARGTVDPEDVVEAMLDALKKKWGDAPAQMPLEVTMFTAALAG